MDFQKIVWDLITRSIPVVLVYLWKRRDVKRLKVVKSTNETNLNLINNIVKTKLSKDLYFFINQVFKRFGADRVLFLMALNGKTNPSNVSVFFADETDEIKAEIPPEKKYKNIKIDDWYKKMLYHIENIGYVYLEVERMPECQLKEFYITEGVKFSLVFFLKRYSLDKKNDAIIYCSIAVHKKVNWVKSQLVDMIKVTKAKAIPIIDKIVQ